MSKFCQAVMGSPMMAQHMPRDDPRCFSIPKACKGGIQVMMNSLFMMDLSGMHQPFTCLACSNAAAAMIIDDHGIAGLDKLYFIMDTYIETLCQNVK